MIDRARSNTAQLGHKNVEFRLGEIENLPVADNAIDAVISNCVINLSPNKRRVFEEAFRVLKPKGRLMISDIVLLKKLPVAIRQSAEAYIGCISGAVLKDEYLRTIRDAGFKEVKIMGEMKFPLEHMVNDPTVKKIIKKLKISAGKARELADSVVSVKISGVKPRIDRRKALSLRASSSLAKCNFRSRSSNSVVDGAQGLIMTST